MDSRPVPRPQRQVQTPHESSSPARATQPAEDLLCAPDSDCFLFLPSLRVPAARLSLGQKENDVKDWLPSDFPETAELEWFADHFAGESFVLATWPGCTSGDQRLKLFGQKLLHESDSYDPSADFPLELARDLRASQRGRQRVAVAACRQRFFRLGRRAGKVAAHAQRSVVLHHPRRPTLSVGGSESTVQPLRFAASRSRWGSSS